MEDTNINETVETTETQEETRTYTFDEVQALLQKEGDRRVTAALKKAEAKHAKELSLSKLDEDERVRAEQIARIEELEAQLQQYAVEKAKAEIMSVLNARGLDSGFANYLHITEDTAENQETIDAFDKMFKKAVREAVEAKLAASGGTPKGAGSVVSGEITKEQFSAMDFIQQAQLYNDNPELWKKLAN